MPRVDGQYVAPHPDVVPETIIESDVHNDTIHDLVDVANFPRPLVAGGTGAINPEGARASLQDEVRGVAVTNYDSHVFEAGSFYSEPTATGAPAAQYFTGICIPLNSNALVIVVRQLGTASANVAYTRERNGGVWGAWKIDGADQYVNVAGDTMTGGLTVPSIGLNANNLIVSDGTNLILRSAGQVGVQNLSGSADAPIYIGTPTVAQHAATKAYVDAIPAAGTAHVLKTGDTMTGELRLENTSGPDLTWAQGGSLWSWNAGANGFGLTAFISPAPAGPAIWNILQCDMSTGPPAGHVLPGSFQIHQKLKLSTVPSTGAAANMVLSGTDVLMSTSSIRYKTDVQPLDKADADKVLALQPITFRSKCESDDPQQSHLGFIAEDVAEIEPRLVQWDDASPRGVSYDRISVLTVFKLKEQEARIAELLARIEALEAKLTQ
jgi:uncharacterized small protein (DUF1192 family)